MFPALPGISSLCERVNFFSSGKEISPGFFRIRGFIYPGSYLLSRDLSSDYHRRADVSLPGSEWDRVGPSGYDHQASAVLCTPGSSLLRTSHFVLRTSHFVLRTSVCLVVFCFSGLLLWLADWHPRGVRDFCFPTCCAFFHFDYFF